MQLAACTQDAGHLPSRTDSRYLPESLKEDIPDNFPGNSFCPIRTSPWAGGWQDPHRKGQGINDVKVTVHHAIIPTGPGTDTGAMSKIGLFYDAIRRFTRVFYSEFEFTKPIGCSGRHLFAASS